MYLLTCGSGYPVMFIHGMPTSSRLWRGIIDKLCDRFTCLAVDLPGLGRTPKIPYATNQSKCLPNRSRRSASKTRIRSGTAVGHDAGSAVAVHYAYRFQERVDHLVLLSPAMFPELKPFHLFRLIRIPVIGELLAPVVNAIFWNVATRMALSNPGREVDDVAKEFRTPFSGVAIDVGDALWRPSGAPWAGPRDVDPSFGSNANCSRRAG
jgi:pimeloyl-ACP methyl ester carboxylesterase